MSFKKINKEFLLTDSSVNSYGYRLLTDGYMMEEFQKNPIGYYMHATEKLSREQGVLVKWEDFRKEGDKVYAKPCINLTHPRGQRTVDEVESGFLNGASMGSIVAVEMSDDPALKLPGQTGPTIIKWYNREASLVDMPGNYNALSLYDLSGRTINLGAFNNKPIWLAAFGDQSLDKGVAYVHEEIIKKPELEKVLSVAIRENSITPEVAAELRTQYADRPRAALEQIISEFSELRTRTLSNMEFEELDKQGLLEELKNRSQFEFNEVFFSAFGKDPDELSNANSPIKNRKINIDEVIQYGLRRGIVGDEIKGLKENFKNDPQSLLNKLRSQYRSHIQRLKSLTWDVLDKRGMLEELKKQDFQLFKTRFKENFGVDYNKQSTLL